MIKVTLKGNYNNTTNFFKSIKEKRYLNTLNRYAQEGVDALVAATPRDTGTTAESWSYEIKITNDTVTIYWTNSNSPYGVPVAVLIQYGHATRNGGYVQGIDYINPALKPVFDKIADRVWKEVTSK